MWDERKNLDWAPKIFKTERIQTEKINTNPEVSNTNPEVSNTNPENQTQEHKKIKHNSHPNLSKILTKPLTQHTSNSFHQKIPLIEP